MDAFDAFPINYKKLCKFLMESELPSEDIFDRFKYDIRSAKEICTVGRGRSEICGTIFSKILQNLGYKVHSSQDATFPDAFEPGYLVIAISGSGTTSYTEEMAIKSKEGEAKLVTITSNPETKLGGISDYVIKITGKTKTTARREDYIERQLIGNDALLMPLGTEFEIKFLLSTLSVIGTLEERGNVKEYYKKLNEKLFEYDPNHEEFRNIYKLIPKSFSAENPFCGKTVIIGDGFSGLAGEYFEKRLGHTAKKDEERKVTFYTRGSRIDKQDLIFVISGSGRKESIPYELTRKVKNEKGCKAVAITSFKDSPLAKICDCYSIVPGRVKESRKGMVGSYISSNPMKSIFELRTMLALECFIAAMAESEKITESDMESHHSIIT